MKTKKALTAKGKHYKTKENQEKPKKQLITTEDKENLSKGLFKGSLQRITATEAFKVTDSSEIASDSI